jgi:hypothetical protein
MDNGPSDKEWKRIVKQSQRDRIRKTQDATQRIEQQNDIIIDLLTRLVDKLDPQEEKKEPEGTKKYVTPTPSEIYL